MYIGNQKKYGMETINTYTDVSDHEVIDDQGVTTSSDTQTQPRARQVQREANLFGPFRVGIGEGEDLEIIRFISYLQCSYTLYPSGLQHDPNHSLQMRR